MSIFVKKNTMNYKLEIIPRERGSKLAFKTILFNAFKINVIERFSGNGKFYHIIIKLRTSDNEIVNTKDGNGRIKIDEKDFESYGKISKVLDSYEFRNGLTDRKEVEDNYVNYILSKIATRYQL